MFCLLFCSVFFLPAGYSHVSAYATEPLDSVPFISEYNDGVVLWHDPDNWHSNIESDYKARFNITNDIICHGDVNQYYDYFSFALDNYFTYPFNLTEFDYYFAFTFFSDSGSNHQVSGVPTALGLEVYYEGEKSVLLLDNFTFLHNDSQNSQGFTAIGKLPDNFNCSSIRSFQVCFNGTIYTGNYYGRGFVYQVKKNSGSTFADIVSAIQQQTNTLVNNNNSNTDRLLEKPDNNEFSEDKINGQVENIQQKMGVLSFGETALKDFVGIWHTDGDAAVYLPEFNMTIQGQNYKIWDKYTYNLNELNENFGFLLTAIRTASSALLWFMVLQFLIKQFEEFINR